MSKQMYEVDDENQARKPRFSQRAPEQSQDKEYIRPEARIPDGSEPEEITSEAARQNPSSAENSGRQNAFLRPKPIKETQAGQEALSRTPKEIPTTWQVLSTIISSAFLVATLFSIWTPASLITRNLGDTLVDAVSSQNQGAAIATPLASMPSNFPVNKIGIVVGHRGNDTGAVCSNGLTELEVNTNVATFLQQKLIDDGYEVELLDEFDSRLSDYQAGLLISIHADSCDYINDSATGFKVASALSEVKQDNSDRLVQCLSDRYAKVTGLKYHYQSVTTDMTYYHAFGEINPYTTAAIIEVGFLNLDQEILTQKPELLAQGIEAGLQCYLKNEGVTTQPEATPTQAQ